MSNAEGRTTGRQAADVSLLNQMVLEVYLAAWTMAGVKDEQNLRRVAASSDDGDDGETALDVADLEHFIRATWGLDYGIHEGDVAARRDLSTRTGGARPRMADRGARLHLHDRPRRHRDPYLVGLCADHRNGGSRALV
jgi:hypothetical protein